MTVFPLVTERDVRRRLTNARRALTRAENRLQGTPSRAVFGRGPCQEWQDAQLKVLQAERELRAASLSLEAIRAAQPERHWGAWASWDTPFGEFALESDEDADAYAALREAS